MKRIGPEYGIGPWKIDSPIERGLSRLADRSEFWKWVYVMYYRLLDSDYYRKGLPFIEKNISMFAPNLEVEMGKNELKRDMVYSLHRFGCMFDEYFLYNYAILNTKGRESFITDKIRWYYNAIFNDVSKQYLLDNKTETYILFKDYYQREVCTFSSELDKGVFEEFVQRHKKVIVKPINSSCGRGVQIIEQGKCSFKVLLSRYSGTFIAEQLLYNVHEIAELNPSSLNTVRIATVRTAKETKVIFGYLRVGRAGSCVDGYIAGGIICMIDVETGIVTLAADKFNHEIIVHPDNGKKLVGFVIPRWNEVVELAKKLSDTIPLNRYTSWDIALTDKGWILIEANSNGQFGGQMATRKGIKKELDLIIDEL